MSVFAGVSCPRAAFNTDKQKSPAEPFGQEALMYTKELIMQREVDVEVETCDKGGNFIGWLFFESKNLAVSLVEVNLYTQEAVCSGCMHAVCSIFSVLVAFV